MTSLGAIDAGDIDRMTDAAIGAQINVCDTGDGYCRRCRTDLGVGPCRFCAAVRLEKARCVYCRRPMRRGVLRECDAPHEFAAVDMPRMRAR
jgi:hypothetical protein